MRTIVTILSMVFLSIQAVAQVPGLKGDRVLLPNGWWLSPAGTQIQLGDFPMNAVLSGDERFLVVSHSGETKAELWLIDLVSNKNVQRIKLKDTWYGLRFVGEKLYVSGGYQNCVYIFKLKNGKLHQADTIRFADARLAYDGAMSGLDVRGNFLAVVFRNDSTLRVKDLITKKTSVIKLEATPYTCMYRRDGTILVSNWESGKLQAFKDGKKVFEIGTGQHPNEFTLSKDEKFAYVACANDNTVTIINLNSRKAVASVSTAVHPDAPEGSTTNSVTLLLDQKTLLAANADNNSLTIIDVKNPHLPKPKAFIPVGWYPTKVLTMKNGTILVLNGKGGRSFANPHHEYIASLMPGSLSIIQPSDDQETIKYSRQVFANTPYKHQDLLDTHFSGTTAIPAKVGDPSPIKHVFYLIKENRTYDQVLGDIQEGNGDTSLCIFGKTITPNHHKLAQEFVLFDNFYVNSEVSADGHNWSVAGYATDYVEKVWPTQYGGRGGEYVFEGSLPILTPKSGYLWNLCARNNLTFRSYGEYITSSDSIGRPGKARDKALEEHFSPTYRGWDLEYSDIDRYKAWEKEFAEYERTGALPQICIMHLPNDHTCGSKKGALTPRAYVAQNDYALGLIVERISKSVYWKETAVFVVEDDAQNGPDHVDAHRSVALAVSPYTKKHFVDHTLYTTTSLLRTMELILGLPPMSQYDASSTPLFHAFTNILDTTQYYAVEPMWNIMERNKDGSFGQEIMEKVDLNQEDAIPDYLFSEIIWQTVTGREMPIPKYSIFSRSSNNNDDR